MGEPVLIAGFAVDPERAYAAESHLWVAVGPGGRLRVGLDALGLETSGTLAALDLAAAGSVVGAAEPFGSLEAAKFVGPLVLPVAGRIAAVNHPVVADPSRIERDPYGDGWLVEVDVDDPDTELGRLISGRDAVVAWWRREVERYRLAGVLAE